ncbi:hypothetical protein C1701_02380 [Actinoalloteichus sp. AHMU CJ021]|nr:hypothetical protein C1701_02380 [Actinoalloteichus sp. AHMU CJ021]
MTASGAEDRDPAGARPGSTDGFRVEPARRTARPARHVPAHPDTTAPQEHRTPDGPRGRTRTRQRRETP